ncbi:MAG: hypothetical protein VX589_17225 [Myxococcota bacterium]|nr:hypothetical protein [Myxococcota bacterium]
MEKLQSLGPVGRLILTVSVLGGCDSGFGEPCEVPKTARFEKACGTVSNPQPTDDFSVRMTSRASCAVKNFAGCSTRVCMVYRGNGPYCTTPCKSSDECEGSAKCRPIVGEAVTPEQVQAECDPENNDFAAECYCVRESDTAGEAVATSAPAPAPDPAMIQSVDMTASPQGPNMPTPPTGNPPGDTSMTPSAPVGGGVNMGSGGGASALPVTGGGASALPVTGGGMTP